jgi:hypothetical protein
LLKPRFLIYSTRLLVACVACVALILGSPAVAGLAAPLHVVPGHAVTIPAGGTGTIQVQAISIRPGSNLSTAALPLAPQPLAADRVRTALFYGIDWGYTESAPYQVALAVWWVQDSNWLSSEHVAAERIGTAAVSAAGTPSWNPDGTNLLNLVQSGQASISPLTLAPSAQNSSLGNGTVQVTNNSINNLTVYLPYGTVFGGPQSQALVWATGPGIPAPQATPTAASQATATSASSTSTPEPPAPSAIPTESRKGGGQPPPATTEPAPASQSKGKPSPAPSNTPAPPPPPDTPTPLPPATATTPPPPPPPAATDTPSSAPADAPSTTKQGGSSSGTQGESTQPTSPLQQPASQPPDTKGEQDSESAQAPTGDAGDAQAGTSAQEAQAPAGGTSAIQPGGKVYGPPLPPTATPTQANGFPEPVTTTFVPQAIDTSEPSTLAPNPQTTSEVPVPPAQSTNEVPVPIVTNVPTTGPIATEEVKEIPPTGDGNTDVPPAVESVPTPAPTPAPPPTNNDGPAIDATTGGATGDTAAGGSASTTEGTPPQTNPATGGGRSDLPMWLGFASALMVLGGWALRRTGRAPAPAQARTEQ